MGTLAGTIGSFLREYKGAVNLNSGLIVILFGLNFLGIFKMNLFRGGSKTLNSRQMGFFPAMLFGIIFSLGWTPCVGAFLGSALMLNSQQSSCSWCVLLRSGQDLPILEQCQSDGHAFAGTGSRTRLPYLRFS